MFQNFAIKDLTVKLPKSENIKIKFSPKIINTVPKSETKFGFDKKLEKIKDKIGNMSDNIWDKYKLFVNPYILVNLSGIERKYMFSLTNYDVKKICYVETISRAYYKLWEILKYFNLLNDNNKCIVSANLAEGPGGFIQAIIYFRKKYALNKYKCDKLIGITLKEGESQHVRFTSQDPKLQKFLYEFKNQNKILEISYGNESNNANGNLNKLNNIIAYAKLFKNNKADIVTADGGFPTEYNKNIQEQLSNHLIYNEIVTALSVQKIGGVFICKTFSLFTNFSSQILFLLSILYDELFITKPVTSRITNNEHYIVAKGFKGIDDNMLNELYKITEKWYEIDPKGGIVMPDKFIDTIFTNKIPKKFTDELKKYNKIINKFQFNSINIISSLLDKNNKNLLIDRIKEQEIIAQKWCDEYFN